MDPYEETELIIDTDTDSSQSDEEQHQARNCQPIPVPTRQRRTANIWFPDVTSSSSDDTQDEMASSEPAHRVDLYEEDKETKRTK